MGTFELTDRDPVLAQRVVSKEAIWVDVRSATEWQAGHLPGAIHIPVDKLSERMDEMERLSKRNKRLSIVTYCRSGGRAGWAERVATRSQSHLSREPRRYV